MMLQCIISSFSITKLKMLIVIICLLDCEEEMLSLRSETGTRTTVVIKLKGDIDLMVTPLALESLQK